MSAVQRHQTYVAAECTHCRKTAIRICILHDGCEWGFNADCKGHF